MKEIQRKMYKGSCLSWEEISISKHLSLEMMTLFKVTGSRKTGIKYTDASEVWRKMESKNELK